MFTLNRLFNHELCHITYILQTEETRDNCVFKLPESTLMVRSALVLSYHFAYATTLLTFNYGV